MTDHLFAGLVAAGHSATIEVRRNGVAIASDVVAIKGRSETQRVLSDYVETEKTDDWIVKASDYGVEPKPDDRIDDGTNTYKVLSDSAERCWDPVDPFGTLYRVRTVLQ